MHFAGRDGVLSTYLPSTASGHAVAGRVADLLVGVGAADEPEVRLSIEGAPGLEGSSDGLTTPADHFGEDDPETRSPAVTAVASPPMRA
ncbi:hypothetical protein [Streptomyces sp900116325]|uniref:hypothetical protein n=1 Tax=Streptomyces sp. 900116325 TaxID=3154295 RepID=UPI003318C129